MYYFLFVISLASTLFLGEIAHSAVLIDEFQIAGETATTDEYLAVFNTGDEAVVLDGWQIKKRTAGGTESTLVTFPTLILDPQSYLYITHEQFSGSLSPSLRYTTTQSLASNNSALLYTVNGELVDEIGWGTVSTTIPSPIPNPSAGQTLHRNNHQDTGNTLADFIPKDSAGGAAVPPEENVFNATLPKEVIAYSPPLASAPPPKALVSTPPAKKIPEPLKLPQLFFEITTPEVLEHGTSGIFSINTVADPRGGTIFPIWKFSDGVILEGHRVERSFFASTTYFGEVSATSTAGTPGFRTFTVHIYYPTDQRVVFNEVAYNTSTDFIELYNQKTTTTDISGWSIVADKERYTIPASTALPAQGYRVFYEAITDLKTTAGETLQLANASGTPMDAVVLPDAKKGSYARTTLGWQLNNEATPGMPTSEYQQVLGEKTTTTTPKKTKKNTIIPTPHTIADTLYDARNLTLGTTITVEGVVTVPPGMFAKTYGYLNDDTGGIQIWFDRTKVPSLTTSDTIRVTGRLRQQKNIAQLVVTTYTVLSKTNKLEPEELALTEITEEDIGKLITTNGEITELRSSAGYLHADGEEIAVGAHANIGSLTNHLHVGDQARLTGILEHTARGLTLWIRTGEDIVLETTTPPSEKNQNQFPYHLILASLFIGTFGVGACIHKQKNTQ